MVRPRYISLMLALVTLLVYLPVWRFDFVSYDDPVYVTGNRMVQAGLTWAGVKWAFTTGQAGNWHPLTWLSHMLDAQLFGTGPTGPHVVNVLLHVANTVLLFVVLRRFTGVPRWRESALVAALFALHPLHVESVAWVAERKDVLSALFFLLTLLMYARYAQKQSRVEGRETRACPPSADSRLSALRSPLSALDSRLSTLDYCAALLFFALGLMSKPMLVTLPFVLLLLDYWPLRRLAIGDRRLVIRHLVREKVPFFLLSVLSSVVTFVVQRKGGAVQSLASFSMSERIENALVSYARYLGKTLWPADLAVFYPHPGHWPTGQVVFAAILVAGLCFGALWFGRRVPFAATGWFWFFGMMIPTVGLVQVGDQSMADRYTYLPLIGVFIMIAWGADEAFKRPPVGGLSKAVPGIAAGLVIVACAVRTEGQLRHWRNSESLFRHAIAVTKNNDVAHNNLGNALLDNGQVDEAIAQFQKALEIQPNYADAHNNVGSALLQKGEADEAIAHFQKALEIQPNSAEAHYNLGNVLLQKGQVDEAIAHFQKALRIRADHVMARNNLGNAFLQKGQMDEAIVQFQKALELRPDFVVAHHNLASALLQKGQMDEAIIHFQKIVELQPGSANAHNNLGWILRQNGHLDEAMTHLQKALELRPDYPEAHNNLGKTLLQKGRVREAVAHYRAALKIQPENPSALSNLAWVLATCPDASVRNGAEAIELAQRANELSVGQDPLIVRTLAAACAEGGRFAEAVSAAQRALPLAESRSDTTLADALRSQIKLYQAGSPFRDPGPMDAPATSSRP